MCAKSYKDIPFLVPHVGHYRGDRGVSMHVHEEAEIVMVVCNECVFEVDGEFLPARPGEIAILPAKVPHAQIENGQTETYYGLFRSGLHAIDDSARILKIEEDAFLHRWFEDLVTLFQNPVDAPSPTADSLMFSLLSRIHEWEMRHEANRDMHPGLRQAVDYLEKTFQKDISIAELAEKVGLSASHLRTLFRGTLGVGPSRYLQQLRIRASQQYLRNPYMNIKEVSYQCGFRDPNYFNRIFRQEIGNSPGQWRKEHLNIEI